MKNFLNQNHLYSRIKFKKYFTFVNNLKINYYLSPLLKKNNFKHAFFLKESSKIDVNFLGEQLTRNNHNNFIMKQTHSNNIAFTSDLNSQKIINADGLISGNKNQNLWIYTADCMPILFADKYRRRIAAIHCGRKGLEKNIISNAIKSLEKMGTPRKDILVAIGPSISGDNYLLDKKTFYNFFSGKNRPLSKDNEYTNILSNINDHDSIRFDIKKYAYLQLLMENINPNNIDISNICTYSYSNEFHSFRRSKSDERQWNVISSTI